MRLSDAERFLAQGALRFSQPSVFNDPFELNPSFDLMSKQDLAALPDAPDAPGMKILTAEALQSMLAAVMPGLARTMAQHEGQEGAFSLRNNDIGKLTLDSEFGILCLSEIPNSLLMWAHYADEHRGVVFQFDANHSFFDEGDLEYDVPSKGPVDYSTKRPILSHSNLRSTSAFFRKSPEWGYEREWRFIRRLANADLLIESEPHPIYLFGLPADCITGVIIGCNVNSEDRTRFLEACAKSPISGATVFQTRLHDDRYELEIHPPLDGKPDPVALTARICSARESDPN